MKRVNNEYYTMSFKGKKGTNNPSRLQVYTFNIDQVGESTITWATLVKGNEPMTSWSPSLSDIK